MTIGNVSISPAVAAAGDMIQVSCKVTMGSGFYENAREINFYLGNGEDSHWFHSTDWTEPGFYLAAGKSRTFTIAQNIGSAPSFARGDRLVLSVVAITGSESDTGVREATYAGAGMTWLDAWRAPSIAAISARRFLNGAPSQVGTRAAVSLQAALKPGAASGGMACSLSYRRVGDEEYSQPVPVPVGDALAGIADDTALLSALEVELGSEYDLLAYFGDAFESVKQRFRIAKAHTKFSVAKNAPGVSVGQHSTATEESPKFECQYPAYFYGGIPQMDYATGRVDTGVKWIDGKQIYRKVLLFGAVGSGATVNVPTGEGAIAEVVDVYGVFTPPNGARAPIPWAHYANAATQFQMVVYSLAGSPYVQLRAGSAQSATGGHIVIEYTLP